MYRNKKYLKEANGQSCIRCGISDGTIVACHYSGLWSHKLGKGRGIKPHDFCVADLCSSCHNYFDNYVGGNDFERAFEFLMFILQTLARRLEQGSKL